MLNHISNAKLEITYKCIGFDLIHMPGNKFREFIQLIPLNSIAAIPLKSVKESFNWIKFWSIWTDGKFNAVNVPHPPS